MEDELGLIYHETAAEMVPHCDVVTINCPLHPETEHLFDEAVPWGYLHCSFNLWTLGRNYIY